MSDRSTFAHFLHDAGLAVWFGGSLMGAVGVNGAAAQLDDPGQRARAASAGWARWTPVNAAAIGAHLIGSVGQLRANRDRVAQQHGVAAMSGVKTLLTAAALGVTAYSRVLGKVVSQGGATPSKRGTKPSKRARAEIAAAQQRLDVLQWVVPALTGALVVVSSYAGEQQRPSEVLHGVSEKRSAG